MVYAPTSTMVTNIFPAFNNLIFDNLSLASEMRQPTHNPAKPLNKPVRIIPHSSVSQSSPLILTANAPYISNGANTRYMCIPRLEHIFGKIK